MKGSELKRVRERLRLTQVQLAAELGIQSNTVARYERDVLAIPRTVELAVQALEVKKGRVK